MLAWTGVAIACAGPTAALTATVLMTRAASMATTVRVNFDCDDIFILPFARLIPAGSCHLLIKERANPEKLPKTSVADGGWENLPTKYWRGIPNLGWNIRHDRRVLASTDQ